MFSIPGPLPPSLRCFSLKSFSADALICVFLFRSNSCCLVVFYYLNSLCFNTSPRFFGGGWYGFDFLAREKKAICRWFCYMGHIPTAAFCLETHQLCHRYFWSFRDTKTEKCCWTRFSLKAPGLCLSLDDQKRRCLDTHNLLGLFWFTGALITSPPTGRKQPALASATSAEHNMHDQLQTSRTLLSLLTAVVQLNLWHLWTTARAAMLVWTGIQTSRVERDRFSLKVPSSWPKSPNQQGVVIVHVIVSKHLSVCPLKLKVFRQRRPEAFPNFCCSVSKPQDLWIAGVAAAELTCFQTNSWSYGCGLPPHHPVLAEQGRSAERELVTGLMAWR